MLKFDLLQSDTASADVSDPGTHARCRLCSLIPTRPTQANPGHSGAGVGHAGDDAGVEGCELEFLGQLFIALHHFTGNHLGRHMHLAPNAAPNSVHTPDSVIAIV